MVSTAILVGALIIGDSIRFSLRQIVFDRLGNTQFALTSGDRFFRTNVADKLSEQLQTPVAPLLQTKGIVIVGGGQKRVNNVQIVGFDNRFGSISNFSGFSEYIAPDDAIINTHLANRLQIKEGDELLLRINNPDIIPKDISWALDSNVSYAKRCTVKSIVSREEFGGFNLKTDQIVPNTVFVSLQFLGSEMGLDNKANVLLVAESQDNPVTITNVSAAFKENWSLTDAGFTFTPLLKNGQVELKSERIFLDSSVINEAHKLYDNTQDIFSYFVNEIRLNDRFAPYSFVSAVSDFDLDENEILINEWLADDLHAQKGDLLTLSYYILGPMRSLVETSADFRVKAVVPIKDIYADRDLIPNFPGLSNEDNCRNWDPGIPVDLDKIRQKDELYWEKYRGTPKVFLSLRAAQKMWQNRFGNLTAIRFPGDNVEQIEKTLDRGIDPTSLGFFFRDVKSAGIMASTHAVDFDQLFLGLSFFIIVAALLLTGLLYVFTIEQRSEEIGLLLALGFTKNSIKHLIMNEGLMLVIFGSLAGIFPGMIYNQIVMIALRSVWNNIVGTTSIEINVRFSTIVLAAVIGIIINLLTIRVVVGNQFKQTIADLQKGVTKLETITTKRPVFSLVSGLLCVFGVVFILIFSSTGNEREMIMPFYSAGILLLIGCIAFVKYFIESYAKKVNGKKLNVINIGFRNTVRKRFRSLAVVGLLACGIFIVFTIGANRRSPLTHAEKRNSTTGGFALFGESVIPILYDLNSEKGRDFYGLNIVNAEKVKFVSFRVREGDDASCLNLNRISTPQLIGVNPSELAKRKAFSFAKITDEVNADNPWNVLERDLSDDVIPGIADQTVIVWGLGKAVGDTLNYVDENGNTFGIKLVGGLINSIFQGNVIISEKAFIQKYPSISGARLFLVDAPLDEIDEVYQKISWALQDQGIDITKTYDRLTQFTQVENTYLSIFLILGTLGLIIGSIGIGIVIGRNVFERLGELALLKAVGFNGKTIQHLIFSEHSVLLFSGITIGILSALVATLPALKQSGTEIPYISIILLSVLIVVNGGFWIYFSTNRTIKKREILPSLRNE
ncbi:MAG: FtsX-like permease family protein [Candidatus Latescibacteria bacterium]|nr:FtsX-like permease family protein [Candidatus Latescibacterota bacterium]